MFKARCKLSALLVGIALASSVHALGLGPVELQSRLSEPLRADIPLYGVSPANFQHIQVRLANREEFSRLGLDYLPDISRLQLQVVAQERRVVLQIRSAQVIREPMISIAVVAEEHGVRVMREFALLFDLPATGDASANQNSANFPVMSNPAASNTASNSLTTSNTFVDSSAQNNDNINARLPFFYGPIQAGDTLSSIAMKLAKNQNQSWMAMATALFKLNPQAFIGDDPNKLMMAVQLQVPTAEQLASYANDDWRQLINTPSSATPIIATTSVTSSQSNLTNTVISPEVSPEVSRTDSITSEQLQQLLAKNAELKAMVTASEARIAKLEARILALPTVTTSQPVAVLPAPVQETLALPLPEPAATTHAQTTSLSPVDTEVIAPQMPRTSPIVTIRDQTEAPATTPTVSGDESPKAWQEMFWYLSAILGLMGLGILIWTWREKVGMQKRLLLQRVRYRRELKSQLPLPDTQEGAKDNPADTSIADRRMLRFQQIQAAVETYVSYKRFDRAEELLQKEISGAKDDLIFRRQLTRLLKTLEHQRVTEEVIAAEQLHGFEQEPHKSIVSLVNKDSQRSLGK